MVDYLRSVLTGQFEAALCMLDHTIRACPAEHWEGKIANGTVRWAAYHTLFWVDLYLSPGDEDAFVLRDLHQRGGDEREDKLTLGLSQQETLEYLAFCRQKMLDTLAAETAESLQRPCGISFRKITRGELHIYNLRHVQHHTGQLSAYVRRVDPANTTARKVLPWVETGWK
jgi:hypothetical protein